MSAEYYGHEETAFHTDIRGVSRDKYNNEGMGSHTDVRGVSRGFSCVINVDSKDFLVSS